MQHAECTNGDTPAALDAIPERYWRNARFLSRTDQEKLLQAHVVIIGLGGLGGFLRSSCGSALVRLPALIWMSLNFRI